MSHTLHIDVPDRIFEVLSRAARQIGKPPEAIAAQWLVAAAQQLEDDPLEQFIGAFDSRGSNWVDEHDRYPGASGLAATPGTTLSEPSRPSRQDRACGVA